MEEAKVTGPMIIAMKGHPVTGKSTLARAIAEVLKCPIIEMDHIRNCIGIAQEPPLAAEAQNDHDLRCYTSLCAIAYAQLRLGFTIIIDSPLSLRSHLDLVHHLGTSTRGLGTSTRYPLVVIECKPQDVYEWQMRFERDLRVAKRVRSWYKPTTWEDLARLLELYEDYEIEGIEGIWKLVVDTTTYVNHVDLCRAIDYLVAQPNSLSVNLADWGGDGSRSIEPDQNRANDEGHTQRHVHIHKLVLFDSEDGKKLNNKDQVRCEGCLAAISDPIYYHCHGCGLSIHRLCAELPDKKELLAKGYPDFLKSLPKEYYSFSEQRRCATHCKDTFECSRCLFETNLRQALLPSVMDHKCHQHPLHLMLHPLSSKNEFRCQACGDLGHHALYNCSACEFECHVDCALLPHRCKNRHFRHTLTITPPSQSNYSTEEYCDACERYRNPNHWSYSSQQISNTSFTCHLNCCRTPWE